MDKELLDTLKNVAEAMAIQSRLNDEIFERLKRLEDSQLASLKRELEHAKILSDGTDHR